MKINKELAGVINGVFSLNAYSANAGNVDMSTVADRMQDGFLDAIAGHMPTYVSEAFISIVDHNLEKVYTAAVDNGLIGKTIHFRYFWRECDVFIMVQGKLHDGTALASMGMIGLDESKVGLNFFPVIARLNILPDEVLSFDFDNDYMKPEIVAIFGKYLQKAIGITLFCEFCDVMTIHSSPGKDVKPPGYHRVINKSDMNFKVLGLAWMHKVLVGGCIVSGHLRKQPCGVDRKETRLIYIESHARGPHVRRAGKDIADANP
jgi:hypothetical protein